MSRQLRTPMAFWCAILLALLAAVLPARAIDQAKPDASAAQGANAGMAAAADTVDHDAIAALYAKQNRADFEAHIDLYTLRLLAVQHSDQVKILDSWARQTNRDVRHRQSIDGKDPLLVAMDIAFREEAWLDKDIIYIESPPIRDELAAFAATPAEGQRIKDEGLVSPDFLSRSEVGKRLDVLGNDARQHDAVLKVAVALQTFDSMARTLALVPPPPSMRNLPWLHPNQIANDLIKNPPGAAGATTAAVAALKADDPAAALPVYSLEQKKAMAIAYVSLQTAWQSNDVGEANQAIAQLATILPAIDPEVYPSHAKRVTELWYNRTFSGTLVAIVYFAAMVLFFLVAVGIAKRGGKVAKTAVAIFSLALLCHLTAMGVRWWLNGRIPIQNEFESIMGSAALGCCVGLALETWKRNGIFGTAFGFVGFLAATSLLASPYVFGKDLGSAPGKVAGILDTYWLYIHVNIVIASYALIFASAIIALIFLGMRLWHWINPIEQGFDGQGDASSGGSSPGGSAGGGTKVAAAAIATKDVVRLKAERAMSLETLDQANMVVLQMVFWFLGVGIMCGAVWADHSWGRPWGWDPKETFALVTWIVYLLIVHMRIIVKWKSDVTAWLAVAGCGVMLFNWIGVNFWLKGLHSYA